MGSSLPVLFADGCHNAALLLAGRLGCQTALAERDEGLPANVGSQAYHSAPHLAHRFTVNGLSSKWGLPGDVPIPAGDNDADGIANLMVWRRVRAIAYNL